MFTFILFFVQFLVTLIMGCYFFHMLKNQQTSKTSLARSGHREMEKLKKMKQIRLTLPLSEKTRPTDFSEIVGQEDGIRALRAALCSTNPQHVLIYGPPGVGKTAASRLVLEEAKKMEYSPFREEAKFVEVDATTMRFDERSIADTLIGSVHDPIYQGAGSYGPAGIPQPKPGAVSKAHGGILFIDEIGELHPIQMNKLLKVLEDRKVFFESVYYSEDDRNVPAYIHDIFKNGIPADFRLVSATTRAPEEIPPAIRSRCVEIFFRALTRPEVKQIAKNAAQKGGFGIENDALDLVSQYADNGRDAVNMIQTSASLVQLEDRKQITRADMEWVIEAGRYTPRLQSHVQEEAQVGEVCGLAVFGQAQGCLLHIEASAVPCDKGKGTLRITGIVESEEFKSHSQTLHKTSSARNSVENMMTLLPDYLGLEPEDYHIHINFPGSVPVDGPSAGIAIVTAVYSAICNLPVDAATAMTGEISIKGGICPVGGVPSKIAAAIEAGAKRVIIPKENWQEMFERLPIEIITVSRIEEVISSVFQTGNNIQQEEKIVAASALGQNISALHAEKA